MNIAIADIDTSLNMDRDALLAVVGAERLVSTSRVIYGNWYNSGRSRYYSKIKGTGFLGLGRAKRHYYRVRTQKQTNTREKTYLRFVR